MSAQTVDQLLRGMRSAGLRRQLAPVLGLRALEERREAEVLPLISVVADQAPPDAQLLHILGLLHRAVGDLRAAIIALDQALLLAPESGRLVHARARAAFEAGLPCLDWYQRARQLMPSDGDIILGQAAAMAANSEASAADSLLAAMLLQHPGWLAGHAALVRLRYSAGRSSDWLDQLDRAIAGSPHDPRLHHLKIMALHRAGLGESAMAAASTALAIPGDIAPLRAASAMVATEHGLLRDADAAFAKIDPFSEPDLAVHWLRHLLRRREPHRISALAGKMPTHASSVAWPYLSIAWRLLGDKRAAWLDDDRLIKIIDLDLDPSLTDTLRTLHTSISQPLDQSVRGGTQTDGPLLSRLDPAISQLRTRLLMEVSSYIEALPRPDPSHPLLGQIPKRPRFVGSWSVRLRDGGFHEPHIHGEGWLSSAFYVHLPDSRPGEEAGWLTLGEPQATLGMPLQPFRSIEPRPGRLVLFPSTMWHGTRPFPAGERLTVAFDIG